MNTKQYRSNLLEKMDTLHIKYEITSIIYSLQFDGVYDLNDCINDLNELLKHLDANEAPINLILSNNLKPEHLVETALI